MWVFASSYKNYILKRISCLYFLCNIYRKSQSGIGSKYLNTNDLLNIPPASSSLWKIVQIVSYFVYHKIVMDSRAHSFEFSTHISLITFDIRSNGITRISHFFHIYWPLLESLVTRFSTNSFTEYFTWPNTCTRAFHSSGKKVRLKKWADVRGYAVRDQINPYPLRLVLSKRIFFLSFTRPLVLTSSLQGAPLFRANSSLGTTWSECSLVIQICRGADVF